MRTGTKSLLFGVHQIVWHPITVFLAWCELICIVIHDWGYWGSPNMDGKEGEDHPKYAARLANKYLDGDIQKNYPDPYAGLCMYHSRHHALRCGGTPSRLCWADKLSIKYDPWWFYLPRAWLSGELKEYRALHAGMGEDFKTHREWYFWASGRAIKMGKAKSSEGISYHPDPKER